MLLDLKLNRFKDLLDLRRNNEKTVVFDPIRKKEIILLPEEMVRQLILQFLLSDQQLSSKKIQVEKKLVVNKTTKRCDIIVYGENYEPVLLVETKSHKVKLNQAAFRQIAAYNIACKVPYLMISNGIETYLCKMEYEKNNFKFLGEFPNLR